LLKHISLFTRSFQYKEREKKSFILPIKVVISLDRYIAVTHPITYPNIMTSKRAKMLICGAWILSFVICFPPLVGWNDQRQTAIDEQPIEAEAKSVMDRCRPQCVLNQEPGYVIYSAVGSFYAPMLVMMFFNWRIYRTARWQFSLLLLGHCLVQ